MLTWYPLTEAKRLPPVSGVYVIRHRADGMEYVGISKNVRRRGMRHRGADKADSYLHRAVRARGPESFDIALLQQAAVQDLPSLEVWHIAQRQCVQPAGYNLTNGGGVIHTAEHSIERRLRAAEVQRQTHLGAKRSAETCRRLSEALRGRGFTEVQRQALLARSVGRPMPEQTRLAIRESRQRPVLVWHPGALLAVEYPSLGTAILACGKASSSVKLCLAQGRPTHDGYAFAYVWE
jgi:group I intron endonuclease